MQGTFPNLQVSRLVFAFSSVASTPVEKEKALSEIVALVTKDGTLHTLTPLVKLTPGSCRVTQHSSGLAYALCF